MLRLDNILDKANAYEGEIILPTYQIRGENRNPVFDSRYGVAHIYPYTLLDDIAPTPEDRTYRTLNLENRYLRVTVLPELGGRVYSVYDKVSECEVFYKNSVVKFAPLAIRGAFFSGGVEFSFPVAHAPTSADPINWELRANEDGSATVSFGGIEHISRMRWMVSLTLYPDRRAFAQDVWLQNPSSIPGRYHYWTNASVAADDQLEFVYPLRRFRSYEFSGAAAWPTARIDLITQDPGLEGMEGVPKWPADRLHQPLNFRWEKNMIAQVSIFGHDVKWDFFGAWRHSSNHGYAHVADHQDVSGMKLWSWGKAGTGLMNQAALTDDGSLYAETQCGAMETQLDFDFLPPGRIRRWREWWLPLHGLGGLTCASVEMGATIHLGKDKDPEHVNLTLGICPARPLSEMTVRLAVQEKILLEQKATATPEKPWLHTEVIEAHRLAGYPLTLTVMDNSGQVILDYTHDREVGPVEPFPLQADTKPATAQDLNSVGLKHENFDNRQEALEAYQKALAMDSAHGPSHLRLGLMFMRAADLSAAEEHFRQAAVAGMAEANYYLGALLLSLDRLEEAERAFEAAPTGTSVSAAARCGLGRIALGKEEWDKSIDLFRQALTEDPDASSVARLLLAVALRRAGREKEAQLELQGLLSNDPLNHPALREMALSLGDQGRPYLDKLARMLADDRQYLLDLACFYIHTRLFADALVVLGEAVRAWNYPMVGYLAWDLCRRLGKSDEASEWLIKSSQAGPDLVFPSRLEEVAALTQAVKENPQDYKAKYYLGTFLYAHERFEEGLTLWEEAAEHFGDFDVVYRNLGLAYWKVKGDLQRATSLLETAQQINPENQDLYLLLDELYTAQRLREKREALLEKMHALNDLRDDVHKRMVVMLVDLGHYQQAIQRLTEDRFVPTEMDQSFRLAYVGAYLERAQAQVKAGRLEEAIADYRRALQFPENVGVGQPVSGANAEILYRLGWAWEQLGRFEEAIAAWQAAAGEHHPHGSKLFPFVQMSLDKLNRYSELGYY